MPSLCEWSQASCARRSVKTKINQLFQNGVQQHKKTITVASISPSRKRKKFVRDIDDPYTVSPTVLNTEDSVCVDMIYIYSHF